MEPVAASAAGFFVSRVSSCGAARRASTVKLAQQGYPQRL